MTAPDFIWVDFFEEPTSAWCGDAFSTDSGDVAYVRRDPAVLAELPEVKAMIAAAVERAAKIAERYGPDRPMDETTSKERIKGRWEGEQAASANIAARIRFSTADAKAALDAYVARKVREALERAVKAAESWLTVSMDVNPEIWSELPDDIRALIPEAPLTAALEENKP